MTSHRADITIVHPVDPWAPGVGGFDSFLLSFLEIALPEFQIEVIGLSRDPQERRLGVTTRRSLFEREIEFLPILHEPRPGLAHFPPLALRFALAARRAGIRPSGRLVQVHRFETCFAFPHPSQSRLVLFLHNHPPELASSGSDRAWRWFPRGYDLLFSRVVQAADAVFGLDPRTRSYLSARWPKRQHRHFRFLPWADSKFFFPGDPAGRARARTDLRSRLKLPPEEALVLFPARLERQKDPPLLAEVFAELATRRTGCTLVVVGEGRLQEKLAGALRTRGLEGRVRFLPPVSRQVLGEILRAGDAVVCTSWYEAGPRMLLEALACGCPVVSTEVGLGPELLGAGGVVGRAVSSRDPTALAAALVEVLDAGGGPEAVLERARTVAEYSPAVQLAPVLQLYRSWLSPPKSSLPA